MDTNCELEELELDTSLICRICLLQTGKFFNIYSYCIVDGYILSIPEMIKSCLELELNETNKEFPAKICDTCKQQIVNFYSFKEKCKKAEQILRCSLIKTVDVKQEDELLIFLEPDLEPEEKVEIENNADDIDTPKLRRSSRPKNITPKVKENLEEIKFKEEIILDDDYLTNSESPIKTDIETEFDFSIENDEYDYDTSDTEQYTDELTPIKLTNNENLKTKQCPKICKQCDKVFETSNNLKRHMEAHLGVQYKCRICSKTYVHQASRNRHMRIAHPSEMKSLLAKKDNPFARNDPKNPPFNINKDGKVRKNKKIKLELINDNHNDKNLVIPYHQSDETGETEEIIENVTANTISENSLNYDLNIEKLNNNNIDAAPSVDISIFEINAMKMYMCELCETTFDTRTLFMKHCKTHDYYCYKCCKVFLTLNELDKHTSNHIFLETYIPPVKSELFCIYCQKRFKSQYQYDQHVKLHESMNVLTEKLDFFTCNDCHMMFLTINNLEQHNSIIHPICDMFVDDRSCTDYQFLDDEKQIDFNSGDDIYKCGVCEKIYTTVNDLKTHIILHLEKFPCPYDDCGCEYDLFSRLSIHIAAKHLCKEDIDFKCLHCNNVSFETYDQLQQHIKKECEERKFQCDHCNKKFFSKKALMHHLKNSREKKYMCQYCGKSFAQQGELTIHNRSHTGERPFQCTVCGKSYKTASMRTAHMDTHILGKTFSCTICSKQLQTRTSFRNHMKRHIEEKKHSCEICLKRFFTKYHVKMHAMKVHHNTKVMKIQHS